MLRRTNRTNARTRFRSYRGLHTIWDKNASFFCFSAKSPFIVNILCQNSISVSITHLQIHYKCIHLLSYEFYLHAFMLEVLQYFVYRYWPYGLPYRPSTFYTKCTHAELRGYLWKYLPQRRPDERSMSVRIPMVGALLSFRPQRGRYFTFQERQGPIHMDLDLASYMSYQLKKHKKLAFFAGSKKFNS